MDVDVTFFPLTHQLIIYLSEASQRIIVNEHVNEVFFSFTEQPVRNEGGGLCEGSEQWHAVDSDSSTAVK